MLIVAGNLARLALEQLLGLGRAAGLGLLDHVVEDLHILLACGKQVGEGGALLGGQLRFAEELQIGFDDLLISPDAVHRVGEFGRVAAVHRHHGVDAYALQRGRYIGNQRQRHCYFMVEVLVAIVDVVDFYRTDGADKEREQRRQGKADEQLCAKFHILEPIHSMYPPYSTVKKPPRSGG